MLAYPLTANAELRALEPWHAAEFAEFIARNREHLGAWLPWAHQMKSMSARTQPCHRARRRSRDTVEFGRISLGDIGYAHKWDQSNIDARVQRGHILLRNHMHGLNRNRNVVDR